MPCRNTLKFQHTLPFKEELRGRIMDISGYASQVREILATVERDFHALVAAPEYTWGKARPPRTSGVYAFVEDGKIIYVGEAKGSGGLWDRLMRKHMSGDDNHAMQRAFLERYPDRLERRNHMAGNLRVKWIEVSLQERVSALESLAIMVLNPVYNRKK